MIADISADISVWSDAVEHYFKQNQYVAGLPEESRATNKVINGRAGSPKQGGVIQLHLQLNELDNTATIQQARYKAYGCGYTLASAAYLCQRIEGKNLKQIKDLHHTEISTALQLPANKLHCAVLAQHALQAAVKAFD